MRIVIQSIFLIERLVAGGENKVDATVAADKCLVGETPGSLEAIGLNHDADLDLHS